MDNIRVTLPEVMLIAGTRVALGVGLALLLADRLSREQRQAAGWALVVVGGLTTAPLVAQVLGQKWHGDATHAQRWDARPQHELYVPEELRAT